MSDFCILLGGTRVPEAPPLLLEAGPLSASFDPDTAFLRDIRWHQAPALMGVYGAVRDRFWGTVDPEVTDLVVERPAGGVRVTFEALCRRDAIRFRWRGRIELAAEGRLRFDFDGEAESAFPRNRIGLCVLHGVLECAGEPCGVTQTSGRCIEGVFPQRIAPHQPFRDIRSIAHELRNGASCTLTLTGETFEMEDQRNWSDASFKTYGTPLDLPIPVQLGAGERVRQSVEVVLGPPTAHVLALPRAGSAGLLVCRRGAAQALPTIGHGLGPECLSEGDTALLRRFARPQLLRYGCRPGVGNWEADLCAAAETARGLGADLEVALALPEPGGDALRTLGDCLRREKLRV
ncbi:MAG: hypothetical protein JXR77_19600, partial [Lentisphaeria bacterium]|nr:hypothetical protein [Lentisphaeria bacterium]